MEKLKNLYAKDIEREIQGVIKVDDESYISQELDEYVVTDELLKHFNSFLDAYNAGINGNTEKMGVWISGFFGSGKSNAIKNIGQYIAWNLNISFPIICTLAGQYFLNNSSLSLLYPKAVT